jgi:hypothetical protein
MLTVPCASGLDEEFQELTDMCILGFCDVSTLEAPRFSENLECDMNTPTMIRWHNEGQYYDQVIPRVVELAGDSKTVAGWVLSDEPSQAILPRMEELRKRFRKVDRNRFCLVVSMWPQTPHIPKETNLPVVCVDLYPSWRRPTPQAAAVWSV